MALRSHAARVRRAARRLKGAEPQVQLEEDANVFACGNPDAQPGQDFQGGVIDALWRIAAVPI